MALWAVAIGLFAITAAIRLRKLIEGEWLLGLSGVVSLVLAALIALAPGPGVLVVSVALGAYCIAFAWCCRRCWPSGCASGGGNMDRTRRSTWRAADVR